MGTPRPLRPSSLLSAIGHNPHMKYFLARAVSTNSGRAASLRSSSFTNMRHALDKNGHSLESAQFNQIAGTISPAMLADSLRRLSRVASSIYIKVQLAGPPKTRPALEIPGKPCPPCKKKKFPLDWRFHFACLLNSAFVRKSLPSRTLPAALLSSDLDRQ